MFLPVSLSKSKFFTCVALVSFVQHSCLTRVVHVVIVSLITHSCLTRVTSVPLVLHSCCQCRTRVACAWHLCCKLDWIQLLQTLNKLCITKQQYSNYSQRQTFIFSCIVPYVCFPFLCWIVFQWLFQRGKKVVAGCETKKVVTGCVRQVAVLCSNDCTRICLGRL